MGRVFKIEATLKVKPNYGAVNLTGVKNKINVISDCTSESYECGKFPRLEDLPV